MNKILALDFDGTVAKSTSYHRQAWNLCINQLRLDVSLDEVLPQESDLKERFDSYRRIRTGFVNNFNCRQAILFYFKCHNDTDLPRFLMDLKESYAVSLILNEPVSNTFRNAATNLIPFIGLVKERHWKIGIISSTREAIISGFLHKCGIIDEFDFILGEETMTDKYGLLHDKPDPYSGKIVNGRFRSRTGIYIGDNPLLDKELADNCDWKFVYADHKTDFLSLTEKLDKYETY